MLDSPRRELARRLWQTIERTSDTLREVLEIRIQTSGGSTLRRAYCEPLQQRRELQQEGEGDRQEQRHTRSDLHNLLKSYSSVLVMQNWMSALIYRYYGAGNKLSAVARGLWRTTLD